MKYFVYAAAALLLTGCSLSLDSVNSQGDNGNSSVENTEITSDESNVVSENSDNSASEISADESSQAEQISVSGGGKLKILCTDDFANEYSEAIALFVQNGGQPEYETTTDEQLYSKISADILSKNAADIAPFDNGLMYPYGVVNGLVSPVDSIIDFSSDLWSDSESTAQLFLLNGWHYVAPIDVTARQALYYDENTIESYGLNDPSQLYSQNNWTIKKFQSLSYAYCEAGGEFAVAGDFEQPLFLSTGKSIVGFDESTNGFVSRLFDADLSAVANLIYDMKKNEMCTEFDDLSSALESGVLFYSATLSQAESEELSQSIKAVPFPVYTQDSSFYDANIRALVLIKGAENTEAAGCFFDCAKLTADSVEGGYAAAYRPSGEAVYPYGMGISPLVSDNSAGLNENFGKAIVPFIYSAPYETGEWDSICGYFTGALQTELSVVNNKINEELF